MSESIGPAHDAGAAKGSTLAAVAVGGVKLAYAAVAARSGRRINGHEALAMARLAGMLVTVIGLFSLGTVLIDALA